MLHEFKNLQVDRATLDEAIALEVFGEGLQSGYKGHGVEEPEWLTDKMKTLHKHVVAAVEDMLDNKIKMAETRLEALKTPGEKKEALRAELAKLRKARKVVS